LNFEQHIGFKDIQREKENERKKEIKKERKKEREKDMPTRD
jgi:hypothetical protein